MFNTCLLGGCGKCYFCGKKKFMGLSRKYERDDALYKAYCRYLMENERERELPLSLIVKRVIEDSGFFLQPASARRIINGIMKDAERRRRLDKEVAYAHGND